MMTVATLLILLAAPLATARPTITTRVPPPPPRLTVGDRFEVNLVVTSPPRALVTGPLTDSMGVFLVGDEKRKSVNRANGWTETTYRLSVAGFEPGTHRLPRFVFLVHGAQVDTLRSDTASVTIASLLPGSMKDINDLKPAEAFPNYWLWLLPAALLLAMVGAWLGRRLYERFKRIQELAQAPLPPWEEALNALDNMPWHEWLAAGQYKRYYYALSEVLKRYLERRFEFSAVEQTTTELLASMRRYKTPMRDDVGRFFSISDLVKYSKVTPPADEAESAIDQVREFVIKTKPVEPAPEPVAAGAAIPKPAEGV